MKLYTIVRCDRRGREIERAHFFAASPETAMASARAKWPLSVITITKVEGSDDIEEIVADFFAFQAAACTTQADCKCGRH